MSELDSFMSDFVILMRDLTDSMSEFLNLWAIRYYMSDLILVMSGFLFLMSELYMKKTFLIVYERVFTFYERISHCFERF